MPDTHSPRSARLQKVHGNVRGDVHGNVHGETAPDDRLSEAVRQRRATPKIRHLTLSGDGWVYQRRAPRLFAKHQSSLTFRKRIGVRSVPDARLAAARIDRLVDALIFVGLEWRKMMVNLNEIAAELDPSVLGFMLERMDAAFRANIDALLDNGFDDPTREAAVITACLDRFRADTAAFKASSFAGSPDAKRFMASQRATAATAIGAYDTSLNNAELNMRGLGNRSFGDLTEALGKTATGSAVIEAGMGAFLEATFGSDEFDAFVARSRGEEAVRQALARRSDMSLLPYAPKMAPVAMEIVQPRAGAEAIPLPLEPRHFGAKPSSTGTQRAVGFQGTPGHNGPEAKTAAGKSPAPSLQMFLGMEDRRLAPRNASSVKLFSVAAEEYFTKREKDRGFPAGASLPKAERDANPASKGLTFETAKTRDLTTLRRRASIFMELIGDHPLDQYTKSDIDFYIHCLRFLPPNASDRDIALAGNWRAYLETQQDLETGEPVGEIMNAKTIEDGYLAGIRPIFRGNPLEDRMVDPIALVRSDYKKQFGKPQAREYFADAQLRDFVREGVARRSLMFIMLPVMGFLTSRRLSALVGLKGSDISLVFDAYDRDEKPVYAACTQAWTDEDGRLVQPSLKTEVSRSHFVLHSFLGEIGFIKWALSLDGHIFQHLQENADHEAQASKVMGRFFKMMGAREDQVFHSLRHQGIQYNRSKMGDENAVRHQAGHAQIDEHSKYGSSILPEDQARRLATLPIPRWLEDCKADLMRVDFSAFRLNDMKGATKLHSHPKPISKKV
jgi:hypothetical protein